MENNVTCSELQMIDTKCFEKVLTCIHENVGDISTVKMLLNKMGISENICKMLFWQNLKTSPMDYIRQYRLEKGCQLLTRTNKSVAEISKECGMNYSYFSRRIREETGMTPLEYRRAYYRSQTEQK